MGYYSNESHYPKPEDLPLTPENEFLREQLVEGFETALSADTTHTFEVADNSNECSNLCREKYLTRVAFLKINGFSEKVADIDDTAPLRVAVELQACLLDGDVAVQQTPDTIDGVGFVWREGVKAILLDEQYTNLTSWTFFFLPEAGGVFGCTSLKTGYTATKTPDDNIINQTYGIDASWERGAHSTEDGLSVLDSLRIMSVILNEAIVDTETTEVFLGIVANSSTRSLVLNGSPTHVNSRQYMDGLLHAATTAPGLRNILALHQ